MKVPEQFRLKEGMLATTSADGNNGAFLIPVPNHFKVVDRRLCPKGKRTQFYTVIVSDGDGWDHVSASSDCRCLTWDEMQYIKQFFWEDEEEAMQLHPRESEYINNHPFTLHMWRPQFVELPKPPSFMVGLKY